MKTNTTLTWDGKEEAIAMAGTPTACTMVPCRDDSVDFDTTKNLFIEGDNLDALKVLQETCLGKVKMIYIDPPYNTGKKFIYADRLSSAAWCSMMLPRLMLARNMLSDDGVIFISIDNHSSADLRKLCDEVFAAGNFIGEMARKTRTSMNCCASGFDSRHESLYLYAKNKVNVILKGYPKDFHCYTNPDNDPRGPWVNDSFMKRVGDNIYDIVNPYTGQVDRPANHRSWLFTREKFDQCVENGRIFFKKNHPLGQKGFIFKRYKNEIKSQYLPVGSLYFADNAYLNAVATKEINQMFPEFKAFDYTKPVNFVSALLRFCTSPARGDIILDFFAGSATTAHAVMAQNAVDSGNRRFILVQLPEPTPEDSSARQAGYATIADISKERMRRAALQIKDSHPLLTDTVDCGFKVYKLNVA